MIRKFTQFFPNILYFFDSAIIAKQNPMECQYCLLHKTNLFCNHLYVLFWFCTLSFGHTLFLSGYAFFTFGYVIFSFGCALFLFGYGLFSFNFTLFQYALFSLVYTFFSFDQVLFSFECALFSFALLFFHFITWLQMLWCCLLFFLFSWLCTITYL